MWGPYPRSMGGPAMIGARFVLLEPGTTGVCLAMTEAIKTADLEATVPRTVSPSQCPGAARSSASAGRSEIMTMPGILPRLLVDFRRWGAIRDSVRSRQADEKAEESVRNPS